MSLYYTAPSAEAFNEMKTAAAARWSSYDDPYKSEKLARIYGIENVQDNFMYLFAMFDSTNQRIVAHSLSEATLKELRDRLLDGGNDQHYIDQITN